MTSVKEFRVDSEPTATELGAGRFAFTDAYSVFDWGQMPDAIPHKGASLCTMGAFNFELLKNQGIPTHYRGVVDSDADGVDSDADGVDSDADGIDSDGEIVDLADCSEPPTEMAIELTQVPDLPYDSEAGYDYERYHEAAAENFLVPLEVVFRNTVPVGSSLRKRGEPGDYGLDADEWPEEAVDLPEPVVEFSTKYEEQDRYLTREEADRIAGTASVDELESIALRVNEVVTDHAESVGFSHEDGKIECLYYNGTVAVADVVGTFDENRFSVGGHQLSKEVIRQYYKREQPAWVEAVSAAKADVADADIADWRQLCELDPIGLPDDVVTAVSDMYAAGANAYTETEWFDAPPVDEAVEQLTDI